MISKLLTAFSKEGIRIKDFIYKWRSSSLKKLLFTYINNAIEKAVGALVETDSRKLTDADFDRLSELIEKKRKIEE
jgi:hypothetical protein